MAMSDCETCKIERRCPKCDFVLYHDGIDGLYRCHACGYWYSPEVLSFIDGLRQQLKAANEKIATLVEEITLVRNRPLHDHGSWKPVELKKKGDG
jgi:hypothetical protein